MVAMSFLHKRLFSFVYLLHKNGTFMHFFFVIFKIKMPKRVDEKWKFVILHKKDTKAMKSYHTDITPYRVMSIGQRDFFDVFFTHLTQKNGNCWKLLPRYSVSDPDPYGSVSFGLIRIIWPDPDPFQTIRIRVAPKTNKNHEIDT